MAHSEQGPAPAQGYPHELGIPPSGDRIELATALREGRSLAEEDRRAGCTISAHTDSLGGSPEGIARRRRLAKPSQTTASHGPGSAVSGHLQLNTLCRTRAGEDDQEASAARKGGSDPQDSFSGRRLREKGGRSRPFDVLARVPLFPNCPCISLARCRFPGPMRKSVRKAVRKTDFSAVFRFRRRYSTSSRTGAGGCSTVPCQG
jgi:hypothetical protein